jgi:hypothetical protein
MRARVGELDTKKTKIWGLFFGYLTRLSSDESETKAWL